MAVSRGVGTPVLVLLLCCWWEAQPWPGKMHSGRTPMKPEDRDHGPESGSSPSSTKALDDDVATVFDEILVQELLDPKKLVTLETRRSAATLPPKIMTKKNEKETLYQIKSLAALEKIIDSLRRIIGYSLKNKQRLSESMLTSIYHKKD
uniref:sperm acrosome-associated protein 7 isoform X1 n=1 Tax=Ictidomys tridecemlineatus TaxID=43179 RepID=UPI001A9F5F75|nr:sperm acrosome-associated protein 7 isoform X1 [Ictidomys tridecemlineatus]